MNFLKQLQFGGVFGGVVETLANNAVESKRFVVRPSGFEPPTFCSGGKRSIQLSYGRTIAALPIVVRSAAKGQTRFGRLCYYVFHGPFSLSRRGG